MSVLTRLCELLALERIEENLYRGQSQDLGWGTVFGGQVLGQALSAAVKTVPEERLVHSLHSYFLRPGRVDMPIVYEVDRIRDGKSFTTRRVVAIQNGRPIFNLSASFQVEELGFEHSDPMPTVDGPDGILSEQDLVERVADTLPPAIRKIALGERPFEIRPIRPQNPFKPRKSKPLRHAWYRAIHDLPDDPQLHQYLLAYASDFTFLSTAMYPHGVSWMTPGMQVASLDHAMWFHRRLRMDEWLLHVVESPVASGARGLVRGKFYAQDGALVATTVQEGLIRDRTRRNLPANDSP